MAYGNLTVYCGPMYSSKTTSLLQKILWASNGEKKIVHVFKPQFDNRYSETEIVNHNGLRFSAHSINDIPTFEIKEGELVFLDEIQFYMQPYFNGNVIDWVKQLLSKNINVVVAGLDMDWQGNPFEITAHMLGMATEVNKLTAYCTVCGHPATKTYKLNQTDNNSVELGATETYEARCNNHWNF